MRFSRLFAVDPSLTCSGWALFSLGPTALCGVGKIRSSPPAMGLEDRLSDLQAKIEGVFDQVALSNNDVLISEAPTTMRDPHAAIKVERVRSIFEVVARGRGVTILNRLHPRTVQYQIMGLKGQQVERTVVKALAIETVMRLYGDALESFGINSEMRSLKKHQDIVDAILVGTVAGDHLRLVGNKSNEAVSLFSTKSRRHLSRVKAA